MYQTTYNPYNPAPLDLVEWRVLNENEEIDNLYVFNKTLFINDKCMIVKNVDGSIQKWEVKKIYPVDEKDAKISSLEKEIEKLKEMINYEPRQSNETSSTSVESNDANDEHVEPTTEATS